MRQVLIVILFVGVAAASGFFFSNRGKAIDPHAGHDHGDFCTTHQIAEADCPFCNRKLIEERGLCREHGVPEALCTRCNPALIPAFKAENDWCAGHNLPESQCTLCNPELLEKQPAAPATDADAGLRVETVADTGAFVPRSLQPPNVVCTKELLQIRLPSPDIADKMGLVCETVRQATAAHTFTCLLETAYNANRHARIAPRLAGILARVEKDLGDVVNKGEALAVLDSVELGHAKTAYLEARALLSPAEKNLTREKSLLERGLTTEEAVLAAESRVVECRVAVSRAEETLRGLGLSDAELRRVAETGDKSPRLSITAPFAGLVVERNGTLGESIAADQALFAIADTSRMWAMLKLPESEAFSVHLGAPVLVEVNGLAGERFAGSLSWISTQIDSRTRTLSARAEVDNARGLLRAGMFGRAEVRVGESRPSVLVPRAAVQWEGCCNVVFVRAGDSLFRPRKVSLAYQTGDHYVVREGLSGGEQVVSTGSFLLKTELLKDNIGAGCCESAPGI
ncbi:efflux RND transporter periplasmic adaptor subunit [bacterium]|nr:efflux RND transporter periplasmic adaptor subunit [bacterium]